MKQKLFNWIGGKKWLAKELNQVFSTYENKNIEYYVEPFAGGLGSFFFTLDTIKKLNVKKIYLNDINNTIVSIYGLIKEDYNLIYESYSKIELAYLKTVPEEAKTLHKTKDKEKLKEVLVPSRDFFNERRSDFNKIKNEGSIESVCLFLFLAQHCFNGVYRENKSGGFNVPYNWEIGFPDLDSKKELLKSYSDIFNTLNIEFSNKCCFEFLESVAHLRNTTLLYCDPPYLNEDKAENKYNKDHFGIKEQEKLLGYYKLYNHVVFSNHLCKIFEEFCVTENMTQKVFYRANIMSAKVETRGEKIPEILAFK
jgi:DNA adenine methylase